MMSSNKAGIECHRYRRWALLGFGWICVGFGALGAVLPVLPTTPFLLLAAWAFSRSSRRLADWLYQHRRFGPILRDWEQHRIIPLRAKLLASGLMTASLLYLWLGMLIGKGVLLIATLLIFIGFFYIWSKPHRRPG